MRRPPSSLDLTSHLPAPLREAWRWKQQASRWIDAVKLSVLIVGGTIACFLEGHVWLGLGILAVLGACALLVRQARRTLPGRGLQRELPVYLALPLAVLFTLVLVVAIIAATAS
jgi:hypothetical protein